MMLAWRMQVADTSAIMGGHQKAETQSPILASLIRSLGNGEKEEGRQSQSLLPVEAFSPSCAFLLGFKHKKKLLVYYQ